MNQNINIAAHGVSVGMTNNLFDLLNKISTKLKHTIIWKFVSSWIHMF